MVFRKLKTTLCAIVMASMAACNSPDTYKINIIGDKKPDKVYVRSINNGEYYEIVVEEKLGNDSYGQPIVLQRVLNKPIDSWPIKHREGYDDFVVQFTDSSGLLSNMLFVNIDGQVKVKEFYRPPC